MNIIIRLENQNNYEEVENLTREAFWDIYHPGLTGKFYEDSSFHVEKKELKAFERKFPYKEKQVTDTQFK